MRGAPAALALAVFLASGPASAAPWDRVVHVCIDISTPAPPLAEPIEIPVGCQLVDCCPGCPASALLDWQVQATGDAMGSLEVAFEGLARPPQVEGDARPTDQGAIVGHGTATLRGLGGAGERVPVATLRLRLDEAALARLQRGDVNAGGGGQVGAIDVAVEQRVGAVVVNEFYVHYALEHCTVGAGNPCDTVAQSMNREGDRSVLLLDDRRAGGCVNDELYRGEATVDVGSVLSQGSCSTSELFVFSKGDAMRMLSPVTSWTDACGDQVPAELDPILEAPINLWVALPTWLPPGGPQMDLDNANLIYDDNKTGIRFKPKIAPINPVPPALLLGCSGGVPPSGFYVPNQLNVYYTASPSTGENCEGDRNVIFIGTIANIASLAHELGHAFSLFGDTETWGHVNGVDGFTDENVMWGGGPATRDLFSLGQAFRFNVDIHSRLNANGVRTGATRDCPAKTATLDCPALGLDWMRP